MYECRGFSGSLRLLMAPSEPKDIECSIVVSVKFCSTLTRVPTLIERLFLDCATPATHLAGISGVHKQHASTGSFSLRYRTVGIGPNQHLRLTCLTRLSQPRH